MKSKDQQLLEEAYGKVRLNNYGMPNTTSKGKPLSPYDDSARLAAKREEQNAGLEDDVELAADEPSSEPSAPSTPPAPKPSVAIDPEVVANKKISFTVWDPGEYIITLDNKPVGGTFSKSEAEQLVQALSSAGQDSQALSHPLVLRWYEGAKNLGDL